MKLKRIAATLLVSTWIALPAGAQQTTPPAQAPQAAPPVQAPQAAPPAQAPQAAPPAQAPQAAPPAQAPQAAPPVAQAPTDVTAMPSTSAAPAQPAPVGSEPVPAEAAPLQPAATSPGATPEAGAAVPPVTEPAPAPAPALSAQPAPPPAQVTPALPPTPPPGEEEEEGPPKPKCVLQDLCLGPVLTLGVINVIGIGAHARYGQFVGFGLDYQFLPTITVGDASAGWGLFTVEGRWYPFGGAFWLGGGFAYQHFSASATGSTPVGSVKVKGTLSMPAIKLGLGFMGHDGFVAGIDLNLNFPLGGTKVGFDPLSGSAADTPEGMMMSADLQDKINKAANKGVKLIPFVPQLNLLRIGYLF